MNISSETCRITFKGQEKVGLKSQKEKREIEKDNSVEIMAKTLQFLKNKIY